MVSVLLAFLLACSAPEPEARPAAPANAQRAKAAKAQAARAARAKAMKARGGKAGGQAAAPAAKIGIAGPMIGELVLTPMGEGEQLKTRAQLRMQWEGGQQAALLGETSGTCVSGEPRPVGSGQVATWWSTCTWREMVADYAVVISGPQVVVQRQITKDGKTSEWTTVRRIQLVEGALLTPGKVTVPEAAPADAQGAPTPPAAPAPAPAPTAVPAPAAPAPAPTTP